MAPSDRPSAPPYSAEDIRHITDPQERKRAFSELSSYIARLKQWQGGRGAPNSDPVQVMTPFRNAQGHGLTVGNDNHQGHAARPQRGGHTRGRGGYSYHPYARPAYHSNRSVVFNESTTPEDTSEADQVVTPTRNGTLSEEGRKQQVESELLCPAFTSTGICSRRVCRRAHDPDKQAICKTWLFKGNCPKGNACSLSHDPTPHNAPTCHHFQETRCTNDNCRFAHIRVNPGALNCEAFGTLGYCEKGAECPELHVHECPYFSNTGSCFYGDSCRWGHVRRASRLRKAARRSSEGLSSPPDTNNEDLEASAPAEAETETLIGPDAANATRDPHQFTQQADFVSLDAED